MPNETSKPAVRFYEEYHNTRKTRTTGNVIAVFPGQRNAGGDLDCMAAVYERPDSPVEGTSTTPGYLRTKCKRVTEARAREIHPNMFRRLDGTS